MESDPRSGRPSTSRKPENVERVWAAINENRLLTVRELGEALGIPWTITKEDYSEVLRRLRDAVRRKRPQQWASCDWQLHHDSAPAHSTALVQDFLVNHRITKVCQSLYRPDLAPCNFRLFPKPKSPLKGRRFVNVTVTQYTSSVNGVSLPTGLTPRESDYSQMHTKVSSEWLLSYIKAERPVLETFKMDKYCPDRPRKLKII